MALTVTTRPSSFNAVHLPIMYKLTSDKWPTNTADTARTVNTFVNDNGYTKLTLSGALKSGVQELEFIKLTVNGISSVYQIYWAFSDSVVTIDLEHDGGNVFGSAQYYYSNYYASIKVYAGLRGGHALTVSKPYRLLTTIKAVPDSANIVQFNINEILKDDIEILSNDLSLSTLPNDIDAFTEFYIEYAEGYDYSATGYTLADFLSSYTSDSANYAIAVNSKLPFKNGNGGVMSAYTGSGQKFLTSMTTPVIFDGYYYDLSFLRATPQTFTQVRRRLYSGATLLATIYDTLPTKDEGVYRHQIQKSSTEDSIIVDLWDGSSLSEQLTIDVNSDCANQNFYMTWKNYLGEMDYWLFTAIKNYGIDIEETEQAEKNIFADWPDSWNDQTIRYETKRSASETVVVRSQNLTLDQIQGIKYIKVSPLVQVVTGTENSPVFRTVLVDTQSINIYADQDKLYTIQFSITYTDSIANQSL